MTLNKKHTFKSPVLSCFIISCALMLSACQTLSTMPFNSASQQTIEQATAEKTINQVFMTKKAIEFDSLLQPQQNFLNATSILKDHQFSCESFENGISVKMTRCQKDYNQVETGKICTDTVWLEHQNNMIKKSQKFFDCQQNFR
jgi:hypothetical protein